MKEKNLKQKNPTSNFQYLMTSKGITLIALVITIIVMLILVAVTISMAINGGLFNYAGKAVGETQNEINKEQELGNGKIQVENIWYNSIDDYLDNKPITNIPEGIKVGDYVNYEPTPGTYTISDEITGLAGYTGSDFTPTGSQTFETQTKEKGNALKWRVWKIDRQKGTVEIVAATQTSDTLRLIREDGYNHAVDILNDMCKALYSNGTAVARSINQDDINSKTTYDPTTDKAYPRYGTQPYTYTNQACPSIYDAELGSTEDMLTENEKTKGLLRVNEGVRQENGEADYTTYTGTNSKQEFSPTDTYYFYSPEIYLREDLGENNAVKGLIETGTLYWLASRCVRCDSNSAFFYVRKQGDSLFGNHLYCPRIMAVSQYMGSGLSYSVRPIVLLPNSVTWSSAGSQTWDIKF